MQTIETQRKKRDNLSLWNTILKNLKKDLEHNPADTTIRIVTVCVFLIAVVACSGIAILGFLNNNVITAVAAGAFALVLAAFLNGNLKEWYGAKFYKKQPAKRKSNKRSYATK